MKVTINGALMVEPMKNELERQYEKVKAIEEFCKKNKIKEFNYKDSNLEYTYTSGKKKSGGVDDE